MSHCGTPGTVTSAISPATLPRGEGLKVREKREQRGGKEVGEEEKDRNTAGLVLHGSSGREQAERKKRATTD